jgi:hypothetical protein
VSWSENKSPSTITSPPHPHHPHPWTADIKMKRESFFLLSVVGGGKYKNKKRKLLLSLHFLKLIN